MSLISLKGILRVFFQIIHLTAFSFILGNLIMDYIFGKKGFSQEDFILLKKCYIYFWILISLSGVLLMLMIILQHNYNQNNEKFNQYKYFFKIKIVLTLITAFGLEFIGKFLEDGLKRYFLRYSRLIGFIILFVISVFQRQFRELKLDLNQEIKIEKKN